MLVPHDNERVRSVQVTSSGVRAAVSSAVLLSLLMATFAIGFFIKAEAGLRAERYERENELLAAEVEVMRGQVDVLEQSVVALSEKDDKFRTIAGLPPLDPDVQRVGIGGPGTATLENAAIYKLDPELGEEVFAASYDINTLLRRTKLLNSSMDEAINLLQDNTARLAATPSIAPADGPLSSLFSKNRRHPVLRITRPHEGIDIAAPIGQEILAPAKGRVIVAGNKGGGYGLTVEIDHGYGYVTRFAHVSRILVQNGDTVERGQVIAEVGATGLVTGPHLHYEVEVNGKPVDPLNFIIADAIPD